MKSLREFMAESFSNTPKDSFDRFHEHLTKYKKRIGMITPVDIMSANHHARYLNQYPGFDLSKHTSGESSEAAHRKLYDSLKK